MEVNTGDGPVYEYHIHIWDANFIIIVPADVLEHDDTNPPAETLVILTRNMLSSSFPSWLPVGTVMTSFRPSNNFSRNLEVVRVLRRLSDMVILNVLTKNTQMRLNKLCSFQSSKLI